MTNDFETSFGTFSDQVDYAVSTAINATVLEAQTAVREHIHSNFIIRRASWIDRSVKITQFAKKDNPTGILAISPPGGEARDVLSKFEDGGTKVSTTGGNVAVPNLDLFPNNTSIIPKSKKPLNLKGAFKIMAKDGKSFIMTTVGTTKNRVYKIAYSLEPSVRIPAKLSFVDTATATVQNRWEPNFNTAFQHAIDTAH